MSEVESNEQTGFQLNKTGLIYDPLMLEFECEWDEKYPEKPDRIKKPYERCEFYGLTEKCVRIPGRFCNDEEVEKYHTQKVNRLMKECEKMNVDELMDVSTKYDSMYFHKESNKAARFALGSSVELMDNIMTGKVKNGFAIIRPPGHHAMHDEPNGYCYFNNAVITAKLAIEKYNLSRVLIVDWDVHHGQGVQYAFYDDPRVLYFSLHRFDFGKFWPNLRQSDFDYIGEKEGKGFNINVPLNKTGFGNSEYFASFYNVLLPVAYEYNPELVIISCGYDAAIGCFEFNPELVVVPCGFDSALGDEKGRMKVTPAGYAHLINALSCLSGGKLCVLLEGGYCLKSLSEGVALSVRALLGYPTPRVETFSQPDPVFVQTLLNLISMLKPYWKCLQNLNSDDDSIYLKKYLEDWDRKFRSDINFYSYENPPEKFELTGFYPLYSDDENVRLDIEIDQLILDTDLHSPDNRTFIGIKPNNLAKLNLSQKATVQDDSIDLLNSALENIALRKFMNGIVLNDYDEGLVKNCLQTLKSFERIKKVMIVDFSLNQNEKDLTNEDNVLFVSFNSNGDRALSKNFINLEFSELDETTLISAFLRILMPIAYQFNPDLVLALNSTNNSSYSHLIKKLSALANGNLLIIHESDSANSEIINDSIDILLGNSVPVLQASLVPTQSLQESIKSQIEKLKVDWSCFQFNEKLPIDV